MGSVLGKSFCCPSRAKGRTGALLHPHLLSPKDAGKGGSESDDDVSSCADADTVTFEVQGKRFKVLTSTIQMQPNTLLCALLDEGGVSQPIFVEGDKTLFPYILSWYRHASSMRINIPLTVSKAAMEQECRAFGLPDGVQVAWDFENCGIYVINEAVTQQWLHNVRHKARNRQVNSGERLKDADKAVQALAEKHKQELGALKQKQKQDAETYSVHTLYEGLLQGVTSQHTSTHIGAILSVDSDCWVDLCFPKCGGLDVKAGTASIAQLLTTGGSKLSAALQLATSDGWSSIEKLMKEVAAADGLAVTLTFKRGSPFPRARRRVPVCDMDVVHVQLSSRAQ